MYQVSRGWVPIASWLVCVCYNITDRTLLRNPDEKCDIPPLLEQERDHHVSVHYYATPSQWEASGSKSQQYSCSDRMYHLQVGLSPEIQGVRS